MGQSPPEGEISDNTEKESENLIELNKFWLTKSGEPLEIEQLLPMFKLPEGEDHIHLLDVTDRLSEAKVALEDPSVRALRFALVPSQISEDLFWTLFFYYLDGGTFREKTELKDQPEKTDETRVKESHSTDNVEESMSLKQVETIVSQNSTTVAQQVGDETVAQQVGDESGGCIGGKKSRMGVKKKKKKKRKKRYLVEGNEQEVEALLLKKNFCHLYKIPPQRNAIGHYAEDWNLEKSLWMGTLKIIEPGLEGSRILLRFVNADSSIFLESICANLENGEELLTPVADSSRFWTTFIQPPSNPEKRYAIGFGFAERPCAEDVRFAVADHRDRYLRHSRSKLEKDDNIGPTPVDDLKLPTRSEVVVSCTKVPLLPAPPL